ncbi:MAG: response regulator transcription factor [Dehalococcoidia bacterium]|nr:response regulator transcription factor [Dehalococcoidia bacterium]
MSGKRTSILAVDDDVRMLRMIHRILELEGYRVVDASNGGSVLDIFEEQNPDLILLDIMLPDIDGYTLCRRIREFSQTPVVMVTARGDEREKIQGFDAGADDYVTKPFSSRELSARVRAVLRRTMLWGERGPVTFQYDDLTVDFARRRVMVASQEADLTSTEYRILCYLAGNAGRVVTPNQILERVWGDEYVGETHLLQVYIARLRKKIKDDTRNPRYIHTRSGIGYMMRKSN